MNTIRRTLTLVCVLATGIVATPVVHAAQGPVRWPVATAYRAAVAYWQPYGPLPCQRVQLVYGTPHGNAGTAEAALAGEGVAGASAPVLYDERRVDCTITISPFAHELVKPPFTHSDWQWFCDILTHEIGHLYGLDDYQTNPASIAYPVIEPGSPNYNSVPECHAS